MTKIRIRKDPGHSTELSSRFKNNGRTRSFFCTDERIKTLGLNKRTLPTVHPSRSKKLGNLEKGRYRTYKCRRRVFLNSDHEFKSWLKFGETKIRIRIINPKKMVERIQKIAIHSSRLPPSLPTDSSFLKIDIDRILFLEYKSIGKYRYPE